MKGYDGEATIKWKENPILPEHSIVGVTQTCYSFIIWIAESHHDQECCFYSSVFKLWYSCQKYLLVSPPLRSSWLSDGSVAEVIPVLPVSCPHYDCNIILCTGVTRAGATNNNLEISTTERFILWQPTARRKEIFYPVSR